MTITDQILIRLLAATDAVWLPDRDVDTKYRRHTVLFERRRDYFTSGVTLTSLAGSGAGEAERKQASRAVETLVADGMLTVHKPKWARASSYALTGSGDTRARGLAGLPVYDHDLLVSMWLCADNPMCVDGAVMAYTRTGTEYSPGVWHSEQPMTGVRAPKDGKLPAEDRRLLVALEELHLPFLTRGLMVSGFGFGIWYCLTPAGVQAATAPAPKTVKAPRRQAAAETLYYSEVRTELDRLETTPPRQPGEIGEMPLGHSPAHPRPGHAEYWELYEAGGEPGEEPEGEVKP